MQAFAQLQMQAHACVLLHGCMRLVTRVFYTSMRMHACMTPHQCLRRLTSRGLLGPHFKFSHGCSPVKP